jgi:hypothetical protein
MSDVERYAEAQRKGEAMSGLLERARVQVRQFFCGLHGHDALLHFEDGRISLLCASCGHQSPGWEFGRRAARSERAAAAQPTVRLPLVGHRRVA